MSDFHPLNAYAKADRSEVRVRWCGSCNFYKNASSDPGAPCRAAGCNGTVQELVFINSARLSELAAGFKANAAGATGPVYSEHDAGYYMGLDWAYESAADAVKALVEGT